jgi:hypothetical protein
LLPEAFVLRFGPISLLAAVAVVIGPASLIAQRGTQATCPEPGPAQFTDPERPTRELSAPEFLMGPKPVYPASLRSRNVTGKVMLSIVVQCDGHVDSSRIAVTYASDTAFIRPAIDAVLRSVYRPGLFRGQEVAASAAQVVKFAPPRKS